MKTLIIVTFIIFLSCEQGTIGNTEFSEIKQTSRISGATGSKGNSGRKNGGGGKKPSYTHRYTLHILGLTTNCIHNDGSVSNNENHQCYGEATLYGNGFSCNKAKEDAVKQMYSTDKLDPNKTNECTH